MRLLESLSNLMLTITFTENTNDRLEIAHRISDIINKIKNL